MLLFRAALAVSTRSSSTAIQLRVARANTYSFCSTRIDCSACATMNFQIIDHEVQHWNSIPMHTKTTRWSRSTVRAFNIQVLKRHLCSLRERTTLGAIYSRRNLTLNSNRDAFTRPSNRTIRLMLCQASLSVPYTHPGRNPQHTLHSSHTQRYGTSSVHNPNISPLLTLPLNITETPYFLRSLRAESSSPSGSIRVLPREDNQTTLPLNLARVTQSKSTAPPSLAQFAYIVSKQ